MKPGRFFKNCDGVSSIEFALIAPVLLTFLFGFFNLSILLWADAGLKSAIGEASRMATLYPAPTDAQIKTRFNDRVFGTSGGTLAPPVVTRGTSGGRDFVNIEVTYNYTVDPIFFPGIPVQLSETRRAYLQS